MMMATDGGDQENSTSLSPATAENISEETERTIMIYA